MNVNILLDVAISVVFVFLLFSIMVSGVSELVQTIFRSRGHAMYKAIGEVFNDRLNIDFTSVLYTHPLIDSLKQSAKSYPAYIQSRIFADAVIDIFANRASKPELEFNKESGQFDLKNYALNSLASKTASSTEVDIDNQLENYKAAIRALENSDLKTLLSSFCTGTKNVNELRSNIIIWFDEYMNTVSSWYKRKMMIRAQFIGIAIAVLFNVDCIHLTKKLYVDTQLRNHVVASAISYQKTHQGEYDKFGINDSNKTADTTANSNNPVNQKGKKSDIDSTNSVKVNDDTNTANNTKSKIAKADTNNVDTNNLSKAKADSIMKINNPVYNDITKIKEAYQKVDLLELPIGWPQDSIAKKIIENQSWLKVQNKNKYLAPFVCIINWFLISLGWIITGLAIAFGADYWFNILGKLINVRSAIKPKEGEENSKK